MPLSVKIPFFRKFFVTIPKAQTTMHITVTSTCHKPSNFPSFILVLFQPFLFIFPYVGIPRYRYVNYMALSLLLIQTYHVRHTMLNYVVSLKIVKSPQQLSFVRLYNSLWDMFIPFTRIGQIILLRKFPVDYYNYYNYCYYYC